MDFSNLSVVEERMIRRTVRVHGRFAFVANYKAFNITAGTIITVGKTLGAHDGFSYVMASSEEETNVNRQVALMMATGQAQVAKTGAMIACATKELQGEALHALKKRVRNDVEIHLRRQTDQVADRMRREGVSEEWITTLCPAQHSVPPSLMSDDVPSMSGMQLDE